MKNLKSLLISSLMAIVIFAPLTSFAKDNNKHENYPNGAKVEAKEIKADTKADNNSQGSFWGRVFRFVTARKAKAATVNANTAPVISGIKAPTTLKTGQEGTWTVKASEPQNGSLEYAVDWGETSSAKARSLSKEGAFVQTSTFTHAYANAGTYTVTFTAQNDAGKKTTSTVSVYVTGKSQQAPVIKSIDGDKNIKTGETETVTVKASDPKNGSLSYSADWGDEMSVMALKNTKEPFVQTSTFTHEYANAGTYTATFTVENEAGQKASSSLKITVTDAQTDTDAPIISDVQTSVGTSTASINWTTDEMANSKVYYSDESPIDVNDDESVSSDVFTMGHSLNITGLNADTQYYLIIESSDASDNKITSSESTFTTNP